MSEKDLIVLIKTSEEYQYDCESNYIKYIEECHTSGIHHWGGGLEPWDVEFKSDEFIQYLADKNCGKRTKLFFKKHFNTYCFWFHLRQKHLLNF